jgi:hypothetical protein
VLRRCDQQSQAYYNRLPLRVKQPTQYSFFCNIFRQGPYRPDKTIVQRSKFQSALVIFLAWAKAVPLFSDNAAR